MGFSTVSAKQCRASKGSPIIVNHLSDVRLEKIIPWNVYRGSFKVCIIVCLLLKALPRSLLKALTCVLVVYKFRIKFYRHNKTALNRFKPVF